MINPIMCKHFRKGKERNKNEFVIHYLIDVWAFQLELWVLMFNLKVSHGWENLQWTLAQISKVKMTFDLNY